MRLSLLFFAILLILVLLGLRGARVGLIGILFGVISWVFTIAFVLIAGPFIKEFLINNTGIEGAIKEKLTIDPGGDLERFLLQGVTNNVSTAIMGIIAGIVSIIIALIIVNIFRLVFRGTLRDTSFVGTASRIFGCLWGIAEGVIISWVLLTICKAMMLTGNYPGLYLDISENNLLRLLFENNPIAAMFL